MHRLLTVLRFLCLGFIALLGATSSWAGTCFAFDDTTGSLVVFDQQSPLVVRKSIPIPGGFGGELVEAAYFDGVNNRYYLVRQGSPNTLGYIDPLTDTYIAISPGGGLGTAVTPAAISVGTGNGGTRITGLSYNPISGKWYTLRIDGYLFEINPITGVYVPGAFAGSDYLRTRNSAGTLLTGVEDMVFDNGGNLHITTGSTLHRNVSLLTGYASGSVAHASYIEGMSLDDAGQIRVISGANNATNSRSVFFMNTVTGVLTDVYAGGKLPQLGLSDYESIGCNPFPERSDLELSKSVSPASVIPGGTATYSIAMYNSGVDPAFQVRVLDTLPAGASVLSSSIAGTCTVCSFDSSTGVWSVDQILLGQRLTLSFVISTVGVTPNSIVSNRAQVTQSCNRATGPCSALPDPDSTPNDKSGNYTPTEDDETIVLLAVTPAPAVGKSFVPATTNVGDTALLVITLTNPNASTIATLTSVLSDTYPTNLVNAPAPNPQTNCLGSGAVTAVAGAGSFSLPVTRAIPAGGSCTVTVVVRALVAGVYENLIAQNALQTTVGNNFLAITGTFVAGLVNVGVSKNFVPNSMGAGQTSLLRITLSNPSQVTASLTAALVDDYPSGVVNAATPNPLTNCVGSGSPTATAGGASLTLPATRAIPPLGSCTITVLVTAASLGNYTNTIPIGSLTTTVGENQAQGYDVLTVANPYIIKSFTPASVQVNQISRLVITFVNPRPVAATINPILQTSTPPAFAMRPPPTSQTLALAARRWLSPMVLR
ncbi:MAG: DUF11 domain-containing protein [Brachymonas sp.]|nr:DUF11 domain-containing protein [Brachymonas sp.]